MSKKAQIEALKSQGLSLKEIGMKIGATPKYISKVLSVASKNKVTSSVPLENSNIEPKEALPSSRSDARKRALSRTAGYDINHFKKRFEHRHIAKTYIDPDIIQEGMAVMWARGSMRGVPDSTNLRELEADGWRVAYPDEYPTLALPESPTEIPNNELFLVTRPLEIHNLQIKIGHQKANKKMNFANSIRSMGKEMNGMGQQGCVTGYNNVLTTPESQHMASYNFAE